MDRIWRTMCRRSASMALILVLTSGCFSTFSPRSALEVSRDKLVQISEQGHCDHLKYVGSDFSYHYVYDSRKGHEKSYKVSANSIKLAETFPVGEDSYVLHPWVIEGKKLGIQPDDESEAMRKSARKTKPFASDMRGTPQPVVQSAAESIIGEEIGDNEVEPSDIESP